MKSQLLWLYPCLSPWASGLPAVMPRPFFNARNLIFLLGVVFLYMALAQQHNAEVMCRGESFWRIHGGEELGQTRTSPSNSSSSCYPRLTAQCWCRSGKGTPGFCVPGLLAGPVLQWTCPLQGPGLKGLGLPRISYPFLLPSVPYWRLNLEFHTCQAIAILPNCSPCSWFLRGYLSCTDWP